MAFAPPPHIPPKVLEALELAQTLGFEDSCQYEFGYFIRTLVASAKPGVIAEIGTGCGVGTAWMYSALQQANKLVTVERDERKYSAAKNLFQQTKNVEFILGDWQRILQHKPFQFVFADVGVAKDHGAKKLIEATAVGGMIVLDDFTPHKYWPNHWKGREDQRRARWLNNDSLVATEILLTERNSAILAVRVH